MKQDHDICIVGGGFAGFWSAVAARRVAGPDVSIALVSAGTTLQMRPRLYEANPLSLAVDLEPLLTLVDVNFVWERVADLDVDQNQVLTSDSTFTYDRLVVATGSVMARPDISGIEFAYSIDTQTEAIAFDERLAELAARNQPTTVVVVGGGFVGIELALELRDRFAAHHAPSVAESLRIVLVDRGTEVAATVGEGPRPVIVDALRDARVEVLLGVGVTELAEQTMSLTDGTQLEVDAVVLATGLVASPFTATLPGDKDQLGRVIVDATLRVPGVSNIFVSGDAVAVDTGTGHLAMQSCQHAMTLGRYSGENAARDLLGLPLRRYQQLRYVTCLDLGRAGAVLTSGWERTVMTLGDEAKATKRFINTVAIYPPEHPTRETLLAASEIKPPDSPSRGHRNTPAASQSE